jgi:hypothetical protein
MTEQTQPVGPLSVTFEEIMAKLVGFNWHLPPGVGLEDFLSGLVEEHPIVQEICGDELRRHEATMPTPGKPSELPEGLSTASIPSEVAKQADEWLTAYHECERAFDRELESPNCLLLMVDADTVIPRFCVQSVAMWAMERLGIDLPAWREGRRLSVFSGTLPTHVDRESAKADAYFITMSTLLRRVLSEDFGGTEWLQVAGSKPLNESSVLFSEVGKPQPEPIVDKVILQALVYVGFVSTKKTESRDAYRRGVKEALKYIQGYPWDRPPPYSPARLKAVKRIIAAFCLHLAPDLTLSDLRDAPQVKELFLSGTHYLLQPRGLAIGDFHHAIRSSAEYLESLV